MKIIHRPGFVSTALCDELIWFWENNQALTSREVGGAAVWDGRVVHVNDVCRTDRDLGERLLWLGDLMARVIDFNYSTGPLYPDDIQIVKWWAGHEMQPHADREHAGEEPHETPWREYAGVVYLNDDYEGGRLYFPNLCQEITPVCGTFVAFGGGLDCLHGVSEITRGVRYTCAAWFTSDKARANQLALGLQK